MEVYIDRHKKRDKQLAYYREEIMTYVRKYGHPLTDKGRKKIEESLEQMCSLPDSEYIPEYDD